MRGSAALLRRLIGDFIFECHYMASGSLARFCDCVQLCVLRDRKHRRLDFS